MCNNAILRHAFISCNGLHDRFPEKVQKVKGCVKTRTAALIRRLLRQRPVLFSSFPFLIQAPKSSQFLSGKL